MSQVNEEDYVSEEMDGDYEPDLSAAPSHHLAINKKVRGRPRKIDVSMVRERTNSYRHMDNKIPKKTNRKPSRELDSMLHDAAPALAKLPGGTGRFTGYNLPSAVTDRFDREGYKLGFFERGSNLAEPASHRWIPVLLSEVPEIALSVIPIPGLYNESYKEYFIYLDHLLMKISHEDWALYSKDFEKQKVNNEKIINDSRSVKTGERKHGLVMEYGRS